jgi:hypothetical protein
LHRVPIAALSGNLARHRRIGQLPDLNTGSIPQGDWCKGAISRSKEWRGELILTSTEKARDDDPEFTE